MNKKNIIYVGTAITIVIIALNFTLVNDDPEDFNIENYAGFDFSYPEANSRLKLAMETNEISMSSPVKLSEKNDISKYCSFFEDSNKQKIVEYCTSTELRDSEGKFLGNIHMVGSPEMPKLVIVLVQVNPFMDELVETKSIFRTVTESLVCKCWNEVKPGGLETIDDWVDALRGFHTSDTQPHSQSNVITLEAKKLQIELTTNFEGYLWELLISK